MPRAVLCISRSELGEGGRQVARDALQNMVKGRAVGRFGVRREGADSSRGGRPDAGVGVGQQHEGQA
eukprot:6353937-Lingulodinium_polyedra.AAC.1